MTVIVKHSGRSASHFTFIPSLAILATEVNMSKHVAKHMP